jgi:hypothetical protein
MSKALNIKNKIVSHLPGSPVSTTKKTYCQDIDEILLKVALNITANHSQRNMYRYKNKSVLMDT